MNDINDPGAGLASQSSASGEEVADLYDSWASGGDYDRDVESWGYEAPEHIADQTLAALAVVPGEVLDAGCGTGRLGAALSERGVHDIVGGDFTPVSIEAARARCVYTGVEHLDLNGPLGYADGRFAVTASAGVFTYVTNTEATIRELLRIVQRGGSVLFTQRTDLWAERGCDTIIERLIGDGACTANVSEPMPYLPGHPDFADTIGIRYVTLVRPSLVTSG
jgi:predicted TPR repeat methyltransferase